MAGVALGDIDLHFVWQAWDLWRWAGSGGARVPFAAVVAAAVCVAGVALVDIQCHLAWQVWHLVTSTVIWQLFHTHVNALTHNFVTHNSFTYCSFSPSFRPMPFLCPACPISFSHLLGNYWKKLICGVIRSCNCNLLCNATTNWLRDRLKMVKKKANTRGCEYAMTFHMALQRFRTGVLASGRVYLSKKKHMLVTDFEGLQDRLSFRVFGMFAPMPGLP